MVVNTKFIPALMKLRVILGAATAVAITACASSGVIPVGN